MVVVWNMRRAFWKRLADPKSTECRMQLPCRTIKPADPSDACVIESMRTKMKMDQVDKSIRVSAISRLPCRPRETEHRLHREGVGPDIATRRVAGRVNPGTTREPPEEIACTRNARIVARLAEAGTLAGLGLRIARCG